MSSLWKAICFGQLGKHTKHLQKSFSPSNVLKISAHDSSGLSLGTLAKVRHTPQGWVTNTILSTNYHFKNFCKISASFTSEKQAILNVSTSPEFSKDLLISLIAQTRPFSIIPSLAYQNKSFTIASTLDLMARNVTVSCGTSFGKLAMGSLIQADAQNMEIIHAVASVELSITDDLMMNCTLKNKGKAIDFSLWTKLNPNLTLAFLSSTNLANYETQLQGELIGTINEKTEISTGINSSGLLALSLSRHLSDNIKISANGVFDVLQPQKISAHKLGINLFIDSFY
ncbi:hypothetical protein M0812_22950 [Anaeramoeba flamelloides]|uniref:Uncharacterized protein n=1 Tax=Anaeramoeba flamelloides TaxID=1746091 RepID=A0AAV7YLW7_9EUKA|nr:hypothetical protein M0812_22950 [Anaeramoeba flamelloides]